MGDDISDVTLPLIPHPLGIHATNDYTSTD